MYRRVILAHRNEAALGTGRLCPQRLGPFRCGTLRHSNCSLNVATSCTELWQAIKNDRSKELVISRRPAIVRNVCSILRLKVETWTAIALLWGILFVPCASASDVMRSWKMASVGKIAVVIICSGLIWLWRRRRRRMRAARES